MTGFRRLTAPAYALGLLILLFVAIDLGASLWPLELGEESWRFGALGFLSNSFIMPLLGLGVVLGTATAAGHRVVQRIVAGLALVAALAVAASTVIFVLDFLQIRSQVQPNANNTLEVAGIRAFAKLVLAAVVMVVVGLGAWRAAGETRSRPYRAPRGEPRKDPARVVVGTGRAAESPAAPAS